MPVFSSKILDADELALVIVFNPDPVADMVFDVVAVSVFVALVRVVVVGVNVALSVTTPAFQLLITVLVEK